jgi:hypothetical protein
VRMRTGHLVLGIIGAVLLTLGTLGLALRVYMHIRDGQAAETYENFYGFHIPWSQAAALLVATPFILLGTYALARWQLWRRSRQEGASIESIRKELKVGS